MRYVALGDSFTEGVGDPNKHLPNGVRGWADRVAERLAASEPGWEYANLAIRSKRLRHIIAEQLGPALAMEPTLITLYAGGNDIMDFGTKVPQILADYESLVAPLAATGARLLLCTGYDVEVSAVLEPLRRKNHAYNDGVRFLAAKYGAVLVDYATFDAYRSPHMWGADRLHMSKSGHKYFARQVLEILDVPWTKDATPADAKSGTGKSADAKSTQAKNGTGPTAIAQRGPAAWRARALDHYVWVNDWVLPMFARKLRGTTLGDSLNPRWPEPVLVPRKKGLKKLMPQRAQPG